MISFAALNKEDSGSISCHTPRGKHRSNPTKEAQESAILQLYHGAMRKQQEGDLEGAELMYHEILDSQLIFPIGPSFDAMANTLYRVKFLILKNITSIAKDKDEIPRAISAYLEQSKGAFGIRREHHDFLRIINKYLPPVYRLVVLPDPTELIEVPEIQQRTKRTDEFEATALDEVKQFVENEMTNSGIVQLMFDFLWLLLSHYQFKWSKRKTFTLVKHFIEAIIN